MKKLWLVLLVVLGLFAGCEAQTTERTAALVLDDAGDASADADAGAAGQAGASAGSAGEAGQAGASGSGGSAGTGGMPPTPYSYIVLRQGQSNSLEVATFAGSSLAPWVAPSPTVHYWHINSARTLTVTTFGPLGGKFGSELSLGLALDASATPLYMSTVAIGSTQCPAALPPGPGYYSTLLLAIDAMLAAVPAGAFPVPFNDIIDQGQTDAQASGRSAATYLACLRSVATDIRAEIARVDGNSLRRVHFVIDKVQAQLPETAGTTTPLAFSTTNIRSAEDTFVATDVDAVAIETNSLATVDGFHYTPAGMVTLGGWESSACVGTP
jgi:hypothetical protein